MIEEAGGEQPEDDAFSGEELLLALEQLDIDEPHHTIEPAEPLRAFNTDDDDFLLADISETLPELHFSEKDIPLGEDLVHIFDDCLTDTLGVQEDDENIDPLPTFSIPSLDTHVPLSTNVELREREDNPALTPDDLLEQLDNLHLDDPFHFATDPLMNDPMRSAATAVLAEAQQGMICVPCDGPAPPPPMIFSNEALSAAAAILAEEYEQHTAEDDAFLQEQMTLLRNNPLNAPLPLEADADLLPSPAEMLSAPVDPTESADPKSSLPPLRVSQRTSALQAAEPFLKAFGVTFSSSLEAPPPARISHRECLGHKERILGSALSPDGKWLATAAQDSTVRIWSVATHQQVVVLQEGAPEHEMLRVAWDRTGKRLAGGGADGRVLIWECNTANVTKDAMQNKTGSNTGKEHWKLVATIDHKKMCGDKQGEAGLKTIDEDDEDSSRSDEKQDEDDPPQVYSLQFIEHWRVLLNDNSARGESGGYLLSSSDDTVHLWELEQVVPLEDSTLSVNELFSLHFGDMNSPGYGVTLQSVAGKAVSPQSPGSSGPSGSFGGARNPNNIVFVFDASYCAANDLLGVALSDGSLRIVNSRGVCLTALSLPGCQSHLTSFCWDSKGTKILTTVATGHIIIWGVDYHSDRLNPCCHAIFQGGHIPGRPVFGACFVARDELVLSWGSDGRLCLWDGQSDEELDAPLAVLRDFEDEYPIYTVAMAEQPTHRCITIAGGGAVGGFLGIPAYMVDLEEDPMADEVAQASKRPKTN